MAIHKMVRLRKSIVNPSIPPCQLQIIANKPHSYAMHAKNSKEIIHETWYLQGKPIVVVDPDVPLCFPALPFPSCSKSQVCDTPPRVHQEKYVSKGMRETV